MHLHVHLIEATGRLRLGVVSSRPDALEQLAACRLENALRPFVRVCARVRVSHPNLNLLVKCNSKLTVKSSKFWFTSSKTKWTFSLLLYTANHVEF